MICIRFILVVISALLWLCLSSCSPKPVGKPHLTRTQEIEKRYLVYAEQKFNDKLIHPKESQSK